MIGVALSLCSNSSNYHDILVFRFFLSKSQSVRARFYRPPLNARSRTRSCPPKIFATSEIQLGEFSVELTADPSVTTTGPHLMITLRIWMPIMISTCIYISILLERHQRCFQTSTSLNCAAPLNSDPSLSRSLKGFQMFKGKILNDALQTRQNGCYPQKQTRVLAFQYGVQMKFIFFHNIF